MNVLSKTDEWLLRQAQHVADYAYTRQETSPYAIASHFFMACVTFITLTCCIIIFRENTSQALLLLVFVGGPINIIGAFMESQRAHKFHQTWLATGKVPDLEYRYFIMRIVWVAVSICCVFNTTHNAMVATIKMFDISATIWALCMASALYLMSCKPPSRLEDEQEDPYIAPETT